MGKTDPAAGAASPAIDGPGAAATPGVTISASLTVFGYDDAPHGHAEVMFDNVRVPVDNILLGEGRGFEIAQGRLGPGRIHHCMRLIGLAERALEPMCRRAQTRVAFGKPVAEQTVTQERIAEARIMIEQARLLTLKAADMMDKRRQQGGARGNRDDQGGGAEHGVPRARLGHPGVRRRRRDATISASPTPTRSARTLRLADGPDEVHRNQIARLEMKRYQGPESLTGGSASVLPADGVPEFRRTPVWIA